MRSERSLWPPVAGSTYGAPTMTDVGTRPVRSRVLALEAVVVGAVAIVIVAVLLSLWDAHWHEPFAYDGDAMYYAMVLKTISRYGTYLHNSHLGWPFGQNLADYPEGGDNLNWFMLAVGQSLTGSVWASMNVFYIASFGATAAAAHVVLRILGVRRLIAGAVALLFAFLPYHFFRNETHLQLSMYFMVPFAVLIALMFLSDEPPLTTTDESGRWHFAWRSRRTWLVLAAGALLASGGVYYFAFAMLLFVVAAVAGALAGGRWRPVVACAVLVGCSAGVFALNIAPSIVQRVRHGAPAGVAVRTPSETELYGLRISQLYAPREGHRIAALARLADDSQGTVVPSERGQQLGVIGAIGLTIILVVFVISALRRKAGGWWAGRTARQLVGLGLLALTSMIVGAVSSYSFLLSSLGLRNIRAWNRISVVIGFCALAAIAIIVDRVVGRLTRSRPTRAPLVAGIFAVALLGVGLFDQTSPTDRPDYSAIHARFASDEAFFQAVADRLPAGTPVFLLPHIPFPEVPAQNGTGSVRPGPRVRVPAAVGVELRLHPRPAPGVPAHVRDPARQPVADGARGHRLPRPRDRPPRLPRQRRRDRAGGLRGAASAAAREQRRALQLLRPDGLRRRRARTAGRCGHGGPGPAGARQRPDRHELPVTSKP